MKNLNATKFLAFSLLIVLAGCQQYSLVQAERVSISENFSVEPDTNWNKRTTDGAEIWTIDGESLQSLRLFKGLGDGDTLFKLANAERQENMPTYSDTMSLLEIREFIETSLVQSNATNVKGGVFEPRKFAGHDGFRFNVTFFDKNGLQIKGFVEGAKAKGKLFVVFNYGSKLYYYDKHLKNVENMIQSAQIANAQS